MFWILDDDDGYFVSCSAPVLFALQCCSFIFDRGVMYSYAMTLNTIYISPVHKSCSLPNSTVEALSLSVPEGRRNTGRSSKRF